MVEIAVRVSAEDTEHVLDHLLLIAPWGVQEVDLGDVVELRLRGETHEMPPAALLRRLLAGRAVEILDRKVSNDWQEQGRLNLRPIMVGNKLAIRAPAVGPCSGMIDIEIPESPAFGTGAHPTTRASLELLVGLVPDGSLLDIGSGSGILAIAAAKLGWSPVHAVDQHYDAIRATEEAAELNRVDVETHLADVTRMALPAANALCANVPAYVHSVIARLLACHELPRLAIVSGVLEEESNEVLAGYRQSGLAERKRRLDDGWMTCLLWQER